MNIERKSWEEFRSTDLLWAVNIFLHIFEWSIVIQIDNNSTIVAYPARTSWRGFSEVSQAKGHENVSKYIKDHVNELYEEAKMINHI